MRLSRTITGTLAPPIMDVRRWLDDPRCDLPLIDLSQAVPADPPPDALRDHMADLLRRQDDTHFYGPVLGLQDLREEIAGRWAGLYHGEISSAQVGITAGCNQAFCAAIAATCAPGDTVILAEPWYFNHKMALDMAGIGTKALPAGHDMIADPDQAAALIDKRTRAIALVSPNNPTGARYPAHVLRAFFALAQAHDIALIIDETYLDYRDSADAPHDLFADPSWPGTLIHLYSFSKAYRLTGHRVGAMIAGEDVLAQAEKYLDTISICANQIGQHAALFGLRNLGDFVARDRAEILRRKAMAVQVLTTGGMTVLAAGAYFAYVDHGRDTHSGDVARQLLREQAILTLPGTLFARPTEHGGTGLAERTLRLAFANVDCDTLAECAARITRLT